MTNMSEAKGGGIFVSYRRQESRHLAGRLADRLAVRFGEGQVFMDVDSIGPGVDFAEEISRAVAACRVLLAVIGPSWLTAADELGRRRLDNPDDLVRLEVEAALDRGVLVIPILVEGAVMPTRDDLPGSLAGLARRNALLIRHESFPADVGHLITAIERVLSGAPGAVSPSKLPVIKSAGTASQPVQNLRFDGVYIRPRDSSRYINYFRFFPSGIVCEVTTIANASQVIRFLFPSTGSENISQGEYFLNDNQIRFTTTHKQGRIEYSGTISADAIELHLQYHSYINGYESSDVWKFEHVS
jgi:hypothetical protein